MDGFQAASRRSFFAVSAAMIAWLAVDARATRSQTIARRGSLLLVGGGEITPEIAQQFVRSAGGKNRRFVYIPTAARDDEIDVPKLAATFEATFGVATVTILHTRDRMIADAESFVAPLDTADGVWFGGGRQWRLADVYLGTRVEAGLHAVLNRGGVVGGTSAGASILASYLVRGAPEGNWILSAPGHEQGFGLLPMTAVDQHVNAFHRENDIAEILGRYPHLLGIGLDESTAIWVTDGICTVIGSGRVILHDGKTHAGLPYAVLRAGDRFRVGVDKRLSLLPRAKLKIAPAKA